MMSETKKLIADDDAMIKHMVDRFLSWRLPDDFSPDAGISFKRPSYAHAPLDMPTGTNLFDVHQAEAMVRHMVAGMPMPSAPPPTSRPCDPAADIVDPSATDNSFRRLRNAVEALYYAAYWSPDRPCDASALWTAVREAAGLPPGQSHERLGERRPADGDCETYKLTGEQAVIAQCYRETLAHLGKQVAIAMKAAGLEDAKAMNVPVGEMIRAASILAVAIARRELKREPNPALWRKTTDQVFAEAIKTVDAAPIPDPLKLLREARDYVYSAFDDESTETHRNAAGLLAEIDRVLEAA